MVQLAAALGKEQLSAVVCWLWRGGGQLVVVGETAGEMTGLVGALLWLLYPFPWQHACVPLLPAERLSTLLSPHPYIVGLLPALLPPSLPPAVSLLHVPLAIFTPAPAPLSASPAPAPCHLHGPPASFPAPLTRLLRRRVTALCTAAQDPPQHYTPAPPPPHLERPAPATLTAGGAAAAFRDG